MSSKTKRRILLDRARCRVTWNITSHQSPARYHVTRICPDSDGEAGTTCAGAGAAGETCGPTATLNTSDERASFTDALNARGKYTTPSVYDGCPISVRSLR